MYKYTPNIWNKYDDSLTLEENINNGGVLTKEKLNRLEEAVKKSSADFEIGNIDTGETLSASIMFDEDLGVNLLNITLPNTDQNSQNGQDGKSAYDIWKELEGNSEKTEQEFINSLKGEKGDPGINGQNGQDGVNGKSPYDMAIDAGFQGTEEEWVLSLKGDKGDPGQDGKSAYDIWKELEGNSEKTEQEFINSLKGEKGDPGENSIHDQNCIKSAKLEGTILKFFSDEEKIIQVFEVDLYPLIQDIAINKEN